MKVARLTLHRPGAAVLALLVFAACFVICVVTFRGIISHYYPWFDNVPLIVNSTPLTKDFDWTAWFSRGFLGYFDQYHGWPSPGSAFVRPLVNLLFWVDYRLFGEYWPGYLLTNYLLHSVAVALVFWIARRPLALTTPGALAAAVLFALSPATAMSLIQPSYAADVLAGILVVYGFMAVRGERLLLAAALLVGAVMTKETALVGPFAAIATVLWRGRCEARGSRPWPGTARLLAQCALLGVPLLVWGALRMRMGSTVSGAYPVESLRQLLTHGGPAAVVLRGLQFWPTTLRAISALSTVRPLLAAAITLINAVLVIVLIGYLVTAMRSRTRDAAGGAASEGPVLVALWAGSYLPLLLLLPPEARHGYAFFMFAVPLAVQMCMRSKWRLSRALVAAVLLVVCAAGLRSAWLLTRPAEIAGNFQRRYAIARELTAYLRKAQSAGCQIAYIAPNVVEYGADDALRRFAGVRERVVSLTTMDGLYNSAWQSGSTRISADARGIEVVSVLPPRFHYIFEVPGLPQTRVLTRQPADPGSGDMIYELPEATSTRDLGRTVQVFLPGANRGACFVAFDFSRTHYSLIEAQDLGAR